MPPRFLCIWAQQATAAIWEDSWRLRAYWQLARIDRALGSDARLPLRQGVRLLQQLSGPAVALGYAELALVLHELGWFDAAVLQRGEELAEFERPTEVCLLLAGAACDWRADFNLLCAEELAQAACPADFADRVRCAIVLLQQRRGALGQAREVARRIESSLRRVQALAALIQCHEGSQAALAATWQEARQLAANLASAEDRCRAAAYLAAACRGRREHSGTWLHNMQMSFDEVRACEARQVLAAVVAGTLAEHGALAAALALVDQQPASAQPACHLAVCQALASRGDVRRTRELAAWAMVPGYRDQALFTIVVAVRQALILPRVRPVTAAASLAPPSGASLPAN
jgi:hypothetical protein